MQLVHLNQLLLNRTGPAAIEPARLLLKNRPNRASSSPSARFPSSIRPINPCRRRSTPTAHRHRIRVARSSLRRTPPRRAAWPPGSRLPTPTMAVGHGSKLLTVPPPPVATLRHRRSPRLPPAYPRLSPAAPMAAGKQPRPPWPTAMVSLAKPPPVAASPSTSARRRPLLVHPPAPMSPASHRREPPPDPAWFRSNKETGKTLLWV